MIFLTHFPSLRMKDFLQVALVMLVISIPGTRGHGNPVKDNISVPMKKVTLEFEPRQFDGNLGETVNNLTKDYIKGVVNPTPEEVYIVIVSLPSDINLSGVAWPVLPICWRFYLQTYFWDVCHGPRSFPLQNLFLICPAVIWCLSRALKYKVAHISENLFPPSGCHPRHWADSNITLCLRPVSPLSALSGSYSSVCKGFLLLCIYHILEPAKPSPSLHPEFYSCWEISKQKRAVLPKMEWV